MSCNHTSGTLKILVGANVLLDTLTRLTGCTALLAQNVAGSSELTAIAYLLNAITDDLYKEVKTCVDVEAELRKRNRRRLEAMG